MAVRSRRRAGALLMGVLAIAAAASWGDGPSQRAFFDEPILLGAHRGGARVLPENTAFGFREAARRWPGILLEADARLTADGHVVLLHDETVDRTTDGTGRIGDMTLEQAKRLDAGYPLTTDRGQTYPYRGTGVTIATLQEALAAVPDSRFLIEFKDPDTAIVDATIRAIQDAAAAPRVLLASFVPAHMARARELAPAMAMCYDFETGAALLAALRNGGWADYRPVADVLSLGRSHVRELAVTPDEIRAVRAKGIRFQIHTLNTREEMEHYLALGVDSILTDRPDLLADVIAAWQKRRQPE
ncbi:MAG: hypothetical protein JXR94_04445 [Candidatus Hydrogenedentes bacterium]|nr:hypothetical protein [Candidatus Hydrogenedentota bacterium]